MIEVGASIVSKDFELELTTESISKEELLNIIRKTVQHYLDNDLNHLLNILYRIDVNEAIVKTILSTASPENIADALAEEILNRELKKAEYRLKYNNS